MEAEEHAERRRSAQIASLAEKAVEPFLKEQEEQLIQLLINLIRSREPASLDKLYAAVGGISALRALGANIGRVKKLGDIA